MKRWTLGLIFAVLLTSRLAHLDIVWVEEGYPAAAAIQMLDSGKILYKDIWFDKPAGIAYLYCLWGARTGLALRLADTVFLFVCCLLLYRFGRALWTEETGLVAAALLALALTFGIPAAVMAIAPDLALVLPHIAAVYLAFLKRPVWAGAMAGIGFWINTKALFVLASCAVFLVPGLDWLRLVTGFAAVTTVQFGLLAEQGALAAYWDQVWRWGAMYARDSFVEHPLAYGLKQTLNWCGFQASAIAGVLAYFHDYWPRAYRAATAGSGEPRWNRQQRPHARLTVPSGRGSVGASITLILGNERTQFTLWILLSLIPITLGLRFFPRYYFQLLPVVCLLGARGFTLSKRPIRYLMVALALIPVIRFGPRYTTLAMDLRAHRPHTWSDLALAQDSDRVARILQNEPKGTLFIWGYRPDIYALSRLPAATPFLDSQPLSGVLADRHLTNAHVSAPEWKARFAGTSAAAQPDYIVDGLGRLNPQIAIPTPWLGESYEVLADTGRSLVYRRRIAKH